MRCRARDTGRRGGAGGPGARGSAGAALVLMLGDTSMGMINGYLGPLAEPRRLCGTQGRPGLIIERSKDIDERRIDDALAFVCATAA